MSNTYSISIETGGYRQLDLFAERCGEGNAVVTVADGNGVAIAITSEFLRTFGFVLR